MYDYCVCVCIHVNNLASLKKRKEKQNINPKYPNLVQFLFVLSRAITAAPNSLTMCNSG